jgi:hypothetical protein
MHQITISWNIYAINNENLFSAKSRDAMTTEAYVPLSLSPCGPYRNYYKQQLFTQCWGQNKNIRAAHIILYKIIEI